MAHLDLLRCTFVPAGKFLCGISLRSGFLQGLRQMDGSHFSSCVVEKGEFEWSQSQQSNILGSFFVGYVVTQIPGGVIAEKYGAKWLYGIGVLVTSIFTLLTPVAARHSVVALIAVRIIEGLGEGVTYPAMHALISRWVPKLERSRISTIIYTGSPLGTVVSMSVSGYLCSTDMFGGWPTVFYLFGALGCIWFLFWILLIQESPEVHPSISKEELEYIRAGLDHNENHATSNRIPWCSIATSGPVWALVVTHFGFNWGFYTILTELPNYLSNILHFDIKHNGLLSALPYICQALFAFAASAIADKMRATGYFKITCIRKFINSIAFFIPGILVGALAFIGCHAELIIAFIVLSVAFSGFMYSGFNVTHVDISPEFAGTLMGITNCVANFAGFLAPLYVGYTIEDGQTVQNWGIVFVTTAAIYFVSGAIYNIFASAELQPWGVSIAVPAPGLPTEEANNDTSFTEPPSEKASQP